MAERYLQHEKLRLVSDTSQRIGEFLEWLEGKGLLICSEDGFGELGHCGKNTDVLLAEFFEIDRDKLEAEKRAIIASMQPPEPDNWFCVWCSIDVAGTMNHCPQCLDAKAECTN